MLSLRRNRGRTLEPSAGEGAFLSRLGSTAVGIELDKSLGTACRDGGAGAAKSTTKTKIDSRLIHTDFFAYPTTEQFDTVIGNPPYVRYRDIRQSTKRLLPDGFDKRSNLYLFFIAKCMWHLRKGGELIFITPRDFIKATSARGLNAALYELGTITHYFEMGDAAIFKNASPNCAIWRWEKGRMDRRMATGGRFNYRDGQLWFGHGTDNDADRAQLSDFMDIKVGAVSGADDVFEIRRQYNANGSSKGSSQRRGKQSRKRDGKEMVCSRTAATGETRRMIYNEYRKSLEPHKPRLLRRRIRKFDESNWWEWGRAYCERPGRRIYVNSKTRNPKPFFASDVEAYDGSVIALFPKKGIDPDRAVARLNKIDWQHLGFVCDGRLLFTQRSLATAPVEL